MDIEFFEKFLLWCIALNAVIGLIWFLAIVVAGDFVYKAHSMIFSVSREDFNRVNYVGVVLFKMLVFVLFVVPFIAMKIIL